MTAFKRQSELLFRYEYGRVVALLSKQFGLEHIEVIEDAVQTALLKGLEKWAVSGAPDNPSAWVFRVAKNQVLAEIRQHSNRVRLIRQNGLDTLHQPDDGIPDCLPADVPDDLLRMLFACCDNSVSLNSQLILALKVLCGFSVREIALRLFLKEDNVYKRLLRARGHLKEQNFKLYTADNKVFVQRLPAVLKMLYLMFTEGYLSLHADHVIRLDLCNESLRLAHLLVQHPSGDVPQSRALLALMHLHRARIRGRQDSTGGLVLLEQQDRSCWDQHDIHTGLSWLASASEGDEFSRYHAEAGVAAEHSIANSYHETRWDRVVDCYLLLEQTSSSPIHALNRAIACAEWQGGAAGLAILNTIDAPPWLLDSFIWAAVSADLNYRCGYLQPAKRHSKMALELAPTQAVRTMLGQRFDKYSAAR